MFVLRQKARQFKCKVYHKMLLLKFRKISINLHTFVMNI